MTICTIQPLEQSHPAGRIETKALQLMKLRQLILMLHECTAHALCQLRMPEIGFGVHPDIMVASLVQDRPHILRHKIHAQDSHGFASSLSHLDSAVCHDQGVADEDVGPALGCRCEDTLDLGVHVKVGNNPNLLLTQHLQPK